MKSVQYFTKEYIEECKKMSPEQILEFLSNFTELYYAGQTSQKSKSKLISIKIPENLLDVFRQKCKEEGVNYQTKMKDLMREWLLV